LRNLIYLQLGIEWNSPNANSITYKVRLGYKQERTTIKTQIKLDKTEDMIHMIQNIKLQTIFALNKLHTYISKLLQQNTVGL
jgi:hypothetical protein